ncbi:hypothetical protein FKM82_006096 [Ascaphus truei]
MVEDTDTKPGGKNGKKGLSGSSFFTWFMVIALLGVWTSVAVVWFDLVDYEEVLAKAKDFRYNLSEVLQGKLGIYDADGDGDFDVDDAKVLLGKEPGGIDKKKTTEKGEEPGGIVKKKPAAKVKEGLKEQLKKVKERFLLRIRAPKAQEAKKPIKAAEDKAKKPGEVEKPKKDPGKEKKDKEKREPRLKREEKPKENVRRSTSGKTRERDRGKKVEKKVDKKAAKVSRNDDKRK